MQIAHLRLAALAALLTTAGVLAGSAWTRNELTSTQYVCGSGERFSVDYYAHYVHLRTGAGIFALPASVDEAGTHYSNGDTLFSLRDDIATLERAGQPAASDCRPQRQRS